MRIQIKNLRLRTIIGVQDWERKDKQDVILNISMDFDGQPAVKTDRLEDTVDYRAVTKRVIQTVEETSPFLLDSLAARVSEVIMEDERVYRVSVEIDKPHALRFADSVSVTHTCERQG